MLLQFCRIKLLFKFNFLQGKKPVLDQHSSPQVDRKMFLVLNFRCPFGLRKTFPTNFVRDPQSLRETSENLVENFNSGRCVPRRGISCA